jgi:hypothetical protein
MQILPPPPLPPTSSTVPQPQSLTNALPQVLTQAVAPITPNAVSPTPKSERSQKARRRGELEREREERKGSDGRGDHVNLSV